LIDAAIQQLNDRLMKCRGLIRYCELEAILLSGNINESVIPLYPELIAPTRGSFQSQLDIFLSLPEIAQITGQLTLEMCTRVLRNMVPAMRAMLPQVEALLGYCWLIRHPRLPLKGVSAVSMRRLKNYMRSTCGQKRLNNIALCHVHKYIMDAIDVNELMEFVLARDNRAAVFGQNVYTDCQY